MLTKGFAIITLLYLKLLARCVTIGNARECVGQTIPARLHITQVSKSQRVRRQGEYKTPIHEQITEK